MQELLDIHGQHETQSLLKQNIIFNYSMIMQKINILICYNNIKIFSINIKIKERIRRFESADQALLQRLDLMKFQFEELTEAL